MSRGGVNRTGKGMGQMDMSLALRGVLLGFSIAAPVGPIGVLCIRRTLAYGRATGLATGLGAATADASYGAVAALGLTALTGALVGHAAEVRLVGGALLLLLGLRTLLARPAEATGAATSSGEKARDGRTVAGSYGSALLLTLSNPVTILSFTAIFAGLGAGVAGVSGGGPAVLVAGVFCGSALWWLLLTSVVALVRGRLAPGALVWVNRGSGAILLAFGLVAAVSALGA